jgi:hypothetical protein
MRRSKSQWTPTRQAIPAVLRSAQAKVVNQISDGRRVEEAAESQMDPYWTLEESAEAVTY